MSCKLTDTFFATAYMFCTRTYLAGRLANVMCVQDDWELDAALPKIRRLIKAGPDLSGEDGQFAFHSAVGKGCNEAVRLLLDAGVPADEKDDEGRTRLTIAAICGLKEAAVMLLEKNVKIDTADKWGKTPLMYAAINQPELVEVLLNKGASLHVTDKEGRNAVDFATEPAQGSHLAEAHEKCRQLIVTAKEQEDSAKHAHDAYLTDGLPATRPVAILRPLSFTRRRQDLAS